MRNSILKIMVALVLLALATAWPSLGQSVTTLAKAEIPFDFVVSQKTLPPVSTRFVPETRPTRTFSGSRRQTAAQFPTWFTFGRNIKRQQAGPSLVFNRYGNQYFLSQVWTEFNEVGRQAAKSAAEKELIQTGGPNMSGTGPEVVLLRAK